MVEDLHGERLEDPYRWLENSQDPAVQAWVAAQNAYTQATLEHAPNRQAIRARLDGLLTVGLVGTPSPYGQRFFYTRRDGRQNQPVLQVRDGQDGAERTLLDPNTLSERGLVSLDWWHPSQDGRRVAYGLSEGGDEWSTLRVVDVDSGETLGEEIPRTRACSVAWLPDGRSFYYTRYPLPGTVGDGEEHYNRHVFLHALGTDWRVDEEVFGAGRAREDWPGVDVSPDGRWVLVIVSQGWARSEVYLLDRSKPHAEWVAVHTGENAWADGEIAGGVLYLRTNLGAPNYRVYAIDPERPERTQWQEIIPEHPTRVIEQVRPIAGLLALTTLENATSRLTLLTANGAWVRDVALPGLGTVTGLGGEWDGDAAYIGFTSFAQPSTSYRVDMATGNAHLFALGTLPEGLDPSRYTVRQEWYASKDGTRVSLFLIHRQDLIPGPETPAVLTGYGGFNVSRTPGFDASLPLWLDAGGLYALPNLRGGGEYGEAWHHGGMLGNKQNVFDDFAAAAEWLIAQRMTSPERLAITGGSNGGLLVGAALTQRPELFRAVVCRVPLLDMLRYHLLQVARLWIAEYGSAEDPQHYQWLRAYSPYHHVKAGAYPAVLLTTAQGDSRVDPMHARKMAALLQAENTSGRPVLLREEEAAGHGVGKPRGKVLDELVAVWSFLGWQLGVDLDRAA